MLQGLVLFKIDGDEWALDLRSGKGKLTKGSPEGDTKPDLTLTISDENFAKLVMGKLGPQQVHRSAASPETRPKDSACFKIPVPWRTWLITCWISLWPGCAAHAPILCCCRHSCCGN